MKTLFDILEEDNIKVFPSSNGRSRAHCPFHKGDNEPSFVIYPDESYFCFGCSAWGDVVKFLTTYRNMPYMEAKKYIGEDTEIPKEEKKVIKISKPSAVFAFLYDCATTYRNFLNQTQGALNYLHSRGLEQTTIDNYCIGYTDGHVLNLQFAEEHKLAKETGILNKLGYETLSHRITIPNIFDSRLCDFIIGRTVTNDKIKYLGTRTPKPIMGFASVSSSPILFLVEGQFDWLLLKQWGLPAVVMSGAHLRKDNLALFRDKKVVIVPDNDDVGIGTAKGIQNFLSPNSTLILDYASFGYKDVSEFSSNDKEAKFKMSLIIEEQVGNKWPTLLSSIL